ncbi:NAD(P)-binding protein [Hypoxylon rubiginosum]|uniref:NAD(P)-binding protein n=1 Tax=Hypoxylon rubiginosum TaxID=110542 RepID=A0ACB9YJZ9_9PEZI|nr:NAD(P)-binding protein [Hypoxylon rubiginosum]
MNSNHLTPYPALSGAIQQLDLGGKSILITGGGYGIGKDIACSFAERLPTRIVLIGRTENRLKGTAADLAVRFPTVTFAYRCVDITSSTDVQALFDWAQTPLDVLINNAGYLPLMQSFMDADLDELQRGLMTNVYGTALMTQTFLRHRETYRAPSAPPAVIITMNTAGALSLRIPHLTAYASTKAALARWSELAPVDVPDGVARFISVHPGAVDTQMGARFNLPKSFPFTDAKLVGDFLVWLTSDEARFLSGRFVCVKWDVGELVEMKEEVLSRDLFRTLLSM